MMKINNPQMQIFLKKLSITTLSKIISVNTINRVYTFFALIARTGIIKNFTEFYEKQ
jgi:hypothetical protein